MITIKNRNIFDRLLILLLFIFILFNNDNKVINPTNIEELLYYENQTLNIIVPKKECKYISPMTVYFHSEFSGFKNSDDYEIRKINLKDKNYFVTYYMNDIRNFPQFVPTLKDNGLIRSNNIMGNNNLFFGYLVNIPSDKNLTKGANLNNYQKVGGYSAGRKFFLKNSLYKYYKYKKNIFYNDFDFMPETYIYPEDKDLIETKFENYQLDRNDLWLIKPVNMSQGRGIFIFTSLKEIKLDQYVITQYISNINLINGRKYDLRLYVLISSLNPLRIYLYNEGLVRIAIEKYEINTKSLGNKYMHITNTDLNINNKKFISPNNTNDINSNNHLFIHDYIRYLLLSLI